MSLPKIHDRVRFAPNPRFPDRFVEAEVIGFRRASNANTTGKTAGWVETRDEVGFIRSVRPSRCETIERNDR